MFCTVVAEFLLTSVSRCPSAIAEPLVYIQNNYAVFGNNNKCNFVYAWQVYKVLQSPHMYYTSNLISKSVKKFNWLNRKIGWYPD